jgi:hypothetical protein
MIPLLTLGIPGSAAAAVMLAAFTLHGLQPGPLLFTKQPVLVYTIFAGFLLTNLVMLFMGFLAGKAFAQLLRIPEPVLAPFIVLCCFLGAYAIRNDLADVWITAAFGVLGYLLRRYQLPVPPLILGLILGPLAEGYFRTAMGMHDNELTVFATHPISGALLLASALCLVWPLRQALANRRRAALIRRALPTLDVLLRLEAASQRLYAGFAAHFRGSPALAAFWDQLSADEAQHVAILATCRDMVLQKPPFQSRLVHVGGGALPDANWRPDMALRLLERVEQGIEKSRAGTLTVDEAFDIALSIERSEIQQLYASCLALPPRPFADVILNLSRAAEGKHLEHFAGIISAFSSDPHLLAEAAQLRAEQEERSRSTQERLETASMAP